MGTPDPNLIIITEDAEDNAMLLTAILESHGYKTKRAKNGAECIKIIEKTTPALVMLDIMMPGMDGFETLLKIKSQPDTREIPVIMCTAVNRINDVEKCYQWGAAGYITKPFEIERVQAKVDAVLGRKKI